MMHALAQPTHVAAIGASCCRPITLFTPLLGVTAWGLSAPTFKPVYDLASRSVHVLIVTM